MPAHVLPRHAVAERRRVRERRRDDVARRDLDALRPRTVSFESRPSLWSVFSTSMNSSPRPYLNVTRLQSTQRGTSSTSSCSTFTHSTGPIPSGKSNVLRLGERRGREPAAVVLPDHRRVEALLDRRPDREGRREVVALDDEVRAVADADLVDLGEQLVGGVAGEDVGGARARPRYRRARAGPSPPRPRRARTGSRRA